MKTISLTILSLILGATAFAEPHVEVRVSARFEGFDRSRFAEFTEVNEAGREEVIRKLKDAGLGQPIDTGNPANLGTKRTGNVRAIQLSLTPGKQGSIESFRDSQVPETPYGEKSVGSGMRLEFLPEVKDGKIILSGKSVIRRRLRQGAVQPLSAISYATNETCFSGAVEDGKELVIAVGDGPKDKARIILTARLVTLGPPSNGAK